MPAHVVVLLKKRRKATAARLRLRRGWYNADSDSDSDSTDPDMEDLITALVARRGLLHALSCRWRQLGWAQPQGRYTGGG